MSTPDHPRHRRWAALAVMAVGILAIPALAGGQESRPQRIAQDTALAERIDAVADAAMRETPTAGMSIAVARDGELVFADGYGFADLETRLPATASTVYQIGSVSKQFTAAAVALLDEQGLLSLDDPASEYVVVPPADPGPTLAQLLSHTSGVVDAALGPALERSRDGTGMSTEEALELAVAPGLAWMPGTFWQYGNGNYLLSYEVVEEASGQAYADYLTDEVLPRAGLSATSVCPTESPDGWAKSYYLPEGNWARAVRLGRPLPLIEAWQANMDIIRVVCATAPDLVQWGHALRTGEIVTPAHYQRMVAPTVLADGTTVPYGLGLQLRRFGEHEAVAHGGIVSGFLSLLADFPDDDVTVALLINTGLGEHEVTYLLEQLLAAVFDEPGDQRWTATIGSASLEGDAP